MQRDVGKSGRLPFVERCHAKALAVARSDKEFFVRRHALALAAPAEMLEPAGGHRGISNGFLSMNRFSTLVVSRKMSFSKLFHASEPE